MIRYALRRVLVAIPLLVGVTFVAYFLVTRMPGDPVAMLLNPNELDLDSPAAQAKREELGLNEPFLVRYVMWLGQALQGNIGYSFSTGEAVGPLVLSRLAATAELVLPGLAIAVIVGLIFGTVAAVKRNTPVDYAVSGASVFAISLPSFFVGMSLIFIFSIQLGILPTAGRETLGGGGFADRLEHMILPLTVIALITCADLVRYVRGSLLDVFGADYLKTAKAKGLGTQRILVRHALRNGLMPVITAVGARIPELLGGAIVTETIFQWPGIGMLSVQAIATRDYPVIMGILLVSAVVVLVTNLITDLVYARVDPRVRLEATRA
ncbi:ABC transporter permease [Microbacterium lushaniae]|nr:ABC transporter permease [Microbacterium lushaniae]KAA9159858.1 ABC transporter permease [Microbacterium lushaniae]